MAGAGALKFIANVAEMIGFILSSSTIRSVGYIKRYIGWKFVVWIEFVTKKVYLNKKLYHKN